MKILVMGNPRSGTLAMTRMLQAAGHQVDHERHGPHGTVSCFYFLRSRTPYPVVGRHRNGAHDNSPPFRLSDYERTIHLVRHPLKAIASIRSIVGPKHRQWLAENGVVEADIKPKLLWAANAWYYTNRRIEDLRPDVRIRIEAVRKQWPKFLNPMVEVVHNHRSSGLWKAKPIEWSDLEALDKTLTKNILRMARRYGYEYA